MQKLKFSGFGVNVQSVTEQSFVFDRLSLPYGDKHCFYATQALIPDFQCVRAMTKTDIDWTMGEEWDTDSVCIFGLESELVGQWIKILESLKLSDARQVYLHKPAIELINETQKVLVKNLGLENLTRQFSIQINFPGMETTTVDFEVGAKAGLHFDSWTTRSFSERMRCGPRIVLNLGPSERWLLVVPERLGSLRHRFTPHLEADDELDPTNSILEEMIKDPRKVTCFAICMQPGQGYIASTEAIIHDATSYWSSCSNFSLPLMVQGLSLNQL
jgi:hypothetical protein